MICIRLKMIRLKIKKNYFLRILNSYYVLYIYIFVLSDMNEYILNYFPLHIQNFNIYFEIFNVIFVSLFLRPRLLYYDVI